MPQTVAADRARRGSARTTKKPLDQEIPPSSPPPQAKPKRKVTTPKSLTKELKQTSHLNRTSSALDAELDPSGVNADGAKKPSTPRTTEKRNADAPESEEAKPKSTPPVPKTDPIVVDDSDDDFVDIGYDASKPKMRLIFDAKEYISSVPGAAPNPYLVLPKSTTENKAFTDTAGFFMGTTEYNTQRREYETGRRGRINDFLFFINNTVAGRKEKLYTMTSRLIWTKYFGDKEQIKREGDRLLGPLGYEMDITGDITKFTLDFRSAMYGGVKPNIMVGHTYHLKDMIDLDDIATLMIRNDKNVYCVPPGTSKVSAARTVFDRLTSYGFEEENLNITVRGVPID